jgi:hypothetical protein
MSWRRFQTLLAGLSPGSVYGYAVRRATSPRALTAADAPSYFASFPKAGE